MKKYLGYLSYIITIIGAFSLSLGCVLGEFLFPTIENLFLTPVWYQLCLLLTLVISLSGIVMSFHFRNTSNTKELEFKIELLLNTISLFGTCIFAIIPSNNLINLIFCIFSGSFIFTFIILFSTIFGLSKKSKLGPCLEKVLELCFPCLKKKDVKCVYKKMYDKNYLKSYILFTETWNLKNATAIIPHSLKDGKILNDTIFNDEQKLIYYCLMAKSNNGYLREIYLNKIISNEFPTWCIPFIITASRGYVIKIMQESYNILKNKDLSQLKKFCINNMQLMVKLYSRIISYWDLLYREEYPKYNDYIGYKLFTECFGFKKSFYKQINPNYRIK